MTFMSEVTQPSPPETKTGFVWTFNESMLDEALDEFAGEDAVSKEFIRRFLTGTSTAKLRVEVRV